MTRHSMPDRRHAMTVEVAWHEQGGPDFKLHITFGFDNDPTLGGHIKEAFVAGFRANTGINALANDACILYSRCLQHGDSLRELADTMVENRSENEARGHPASMMGAIARAAIELQSEIIKETVHGNR